MSTKKMTPREAMNKSTRLKLSVHGAYVCDDVVVNHPPLIE